MRQPLLLCVCLGALACAAPTRAPVASHPVGYREARQDDAARVAIAEAQAVGVVHPAFGKPAAPIDLAAGELASVRNRVASAQDSRERAGLRLLEADLASRRRHVLAVQLFVLEDAMGSASAHGSPHLERRRDALLASDRALETEILDTLTAVADDRSPGAAKARPVAIARLAGALRDAGRGDASLARWRALVAGWPNASEAAEAHLALAEHAFADERLADALRECEAVLRAGGGTSRVSALYLRAWTLRGLGERRHPGATREAIEALSEIVRLAPAAVGPADVSIADSAEEELEDLVRKDADARRPAASPAVSR